ncbi:MAG: DUF2232 domain-containing protein [Alphaproteobacteria bacterium]|nr:DUF2232 domain-containing protein [Alphaproteobacteria bacterium]
MLPALPSRGFYGIGGAILAGAISAGLYALAFADFPMARLLVILTPLPIFFICLGAGIIPGIITTLCAIAGVAMVNGAGFLEFLFVGAVPAFLFSILALRYRRDESGNLYWYPSGRLLTALTLYPCVFFVALTLANFGENKDTPYFAMQPEAIERVQQKLEEQTRQSLEAGALTAGMSEEDKWQVEANMAGTQAQMVELIKTVNRIAPGIAIASWCFQMLVYLFVAQKMLANQGWALRATPSWHDFDLPHWFLGLATLSGLMGYFANGMAAYIGINLFIALLMPYLLLGISTVHVWAGQRKSKLLWLIIFYLLLMFGWPMLLVTALGIAEQFADFRKRITTPSQTA